MPVWSGAAVSRSSPWSQPRWWAAPPGGRRALLCTTVSPAGTPCAEGRPCCCRMTAAPPTPAAATTMTGRVDAGADHAGRRRGPGRERTPATAAQPGHGQPRPRQSGLRVRHGLGATARAVRRWSPSASARRVDRVVPHELPPTLAACPDSPILSVGRGVTDQNRTLRRRRSRDRGRCSTSSPLTSQTKARTCTETGVRRPTQAAPSTRQPWPSAPGPSTPRAAPGSARRPHPRRRGRVLRRVRRGIGVTAEQQLALPLTHVGAPRAAAASSRSRAGRSSAAGPSAARHRPETWSSQPPGPSAAGNFGSGSSARSMPWWSTSFIE